jgi:glutathione S-transferase
MKYVLYDIDNVAGQDGKPICWSPNTYKPRPVLAYKKLDYTTRWISYPDIKPELAQQGQQDASPPICPVLLDTSTATDGSEGTWVPESFAIAEYLEQAHPEPTIFPGGKDVHKRLLDYISKEVMPHALKWMLDRVPEKLDTRGGQYFTETRCKRFNVQSLSDISKDRDAHLVRLRAGLTPLFHALRQSGKFLTGDAFGYADICLLGLCQWVATIVPQQLDMFLSIDDSGNFKAWRERCRPLEGKMD